jgi:hypothetical protein
MFSGIQVCFCFIGRTPKSTAAAAAQIYSLTKHWADAAPAAAYTQLAPSYLSPKVGF